MLLIVTLFAYVLIYALLAALAWRDLQEYILPNMLNLALGLTFAGFHLLTGWSLVTPQDALLGSLVGGGFLLVIRFLANKYYEQDSLGLGDVKLMAAAGIGLGFPNIMLAISIGAFAALLHGAIMAWQMERRGEKNINLAQINVPAGLGLCMGIAIVMATQFGTGWMNLK